MQLNRFSQGIGVGDYNQLPIKVYHMEGFRFGRKSELNRLLDVVRALQPQLITMDSLIAMLPGGRQGFGENNAETGIAVRDDLNQILKACPNCNILLAAHSPKPVAEWSVKEFDKAEMQTLVRGHGAPVGEACDTGFALKKLSERPLQFAIMTKARRVAVEMSSKVVYVEMEEESYGKGYARLVEIPPVSDPPSKIAKHLFQLFKGGQPHEAKCIVRENALFTRKQNLEAVEELEAQHVIQNHKLPFTYELNPNYLTECDGEYLKKLR